MLRRLVMLCMLLPALAWTGPTQLRIQGSNTIGSALAPALVQAWLRAQGATAIDQKAGHSVNEWIISGTDTSGRTLRIDLGAHGTRTGFSALAAGAADLVTASRPINDDEAQALQALGDLRAAASEQIIGLDGVAIIVHPDNPLTRLSIEQLAQVFSGQVQRWEQLGVRGGEIHVYARDERSGTFDTFASLVLQPAQLQLARTATRFESADALTAQVARDRHAIGFSGLASVHGVRTLAIAAGDAPALLPSRALVASEDYPLSRRLYFYLPQPAKADAGALADFTQSAAGQAIVAAYGFVSQQIQALPVAMHRNQPPAYAELAQHARRLSVSLRFQPGSAQLDNKALRDVQRIASYLDSTGKLRGRAVVLGFGDRKETPGRAALLSRLRALAVRRELARHGVETLQVEGLGEQLPVAGNQHAQDRLRNRRVEVWVY
ncbi:phosphate ABC transporter substrate-binding/OmpA family protein [Pseudomonas cremoricolorata]|uniref:Membrane protein n=1 Tax=Pseudomonas cremoricolorata TaxID=157783 RepID=A0A089YHV5_9PSED|nr:phosphate ABC transporter substrate-binding/OmpA family protein [Pseudomonas cremoricolorata]AIR91273.1 membrane protein [Pseudomonas cremoricolorata]